MSGAAAIRWHTSLVGVSTAVAVAACGSYLRASAPTLPATSPTTAVPTTVIGPCDEPAGNQAAHLPPAAVLASAALQSATITVTTTRAEGSDARCTPLVPGASVQLRIGDLVEYVANTPPVLTPAEGAVVAVSARPGPTSTGLGAIATSHVVVTLIGETPGVVHLRWTDCSGTGC